MKHLLSLLLLAMPLAAQVDVGGNTGNVQLRILYNGQPLATAMAGTGLYQAWDQYGWYAASGFGGVVDQGDRLFTQIPVGANEVKLTGFPSLPGMAFTVVKDQTVTVNLEIGQAFGVITGLVNLNGQTAAANEVEVCAGSRACQRNDANGRFRLMTPGGAFSGYTRIGNQQQPFSYTATAGTTVDIGTLTVNYQVGNVQLRILYNGQPLLTAMAGTALYQAWDQYGWYAASGFGGVVDQGDRLFTQIPVGPNEVKLTGFPSLPGVAFTVVKDQTVTVNLEIGQAFGVITGLVNLNGQPAAANAVEVCAGSRACQGTDASGRFRLMTPGGAFNGHTRVGNQQQPFSYTATAGTTVDIGMLFMTHLVGNVQLRILYNGQPLSTAMAGTGLYQAWDQYGWYAANGFGGVVDQGDRLFTEIPVGPNEVKLTGFPALPGVAFTVVKDQTVTVNLEIGQAFGVITGSVSVNGQVPPAGQVEVCAGSRACQSNDGSGRFRLMVPGGPGTGTARNGPFTTPFAYTAVAGQTRDIGNPGATVLDGVILGKSGPLNDRAWAFRITNKGPGAASSPLLTGVSLTQTFGAACTPVVLSTMPLAYPYLANGAAATANLRINFASCAANARFTAVFQYSANSGGVTGTKTLVLQQP
jgi:hypothetical protein